MEFLDLGSHCALEECKQKDFLPFKCGHCGITTCRVHSSLSGHRCPYLTSATTVVCPLCDLVVSVKDAASADAAMDSHISSGCKARPSPYTFKCRVKGCKRKTAQLVACKRCERSFCLDHRLPMDHRCAGKPLPGTRVFHASAEANAEMSKLLKAVA